MSKSVFTEVQVSVGDITLTKPVRSDCFGIHVNGEGLLGRACPGTAGIGHSTVYLNAEQLRNLRDAIEEALKP